MTPIPQQDPHRTEKVAVDCPRRTVADEDGVRHEDKRSRHLTRGPSPLA